MAVSGRSAGSAHSGSIAPIRLMHLITDLDVGGAEIMLAKLVGMMDPRRFSTSIVSMLPLGPIANELTAQSFTVQSLGMSRGIPDLRGLLRLVRLLRKGRIEVLQTWLYHADLLGLVAARLARVPRLAWNLRCSDMEFSRYSRLSAALPRLLAHISGSPDVVLVNSEAGLRVHERLGYHPRRWEVVPNGFDTERFRPDLAAAGRLRGELGWLSESFIIALPARFDPMKGHAIFLAAARRFAAEHQDARFVLVGRDVESANAPLRALVEGTGHAEKIALLGERHDMPAILAGVDIVTLSSSFGEGFPNVLGEAMACAVPVVSTAVGDAAQIVGSTGVVVPARDATAMAGAWSRLYELGREGRAAIGAGARQRIIASYALPAVVARYEKIYDELAKAQDQDGLAVTASPL